MQRSQLSTRVVHNCYNTNCCIFLLTVYKQHPRSNCGGPSLGTWVISFRPAVLLTLLGVYIDICTDAVYYCRVLLFFFGSRVCCEAPCADLIPYSPAPTPTASASAAVFVGCCVGVVQSTFLALCSPWYYVMVCSRQMALWAASVACVVWSDRWDVNMFGAFLMAVFWQQCGWLAHDFLHHQVGSGLSFLLLWNFFSFLSFFPLFFVVVLSFLAGNRK